jgi:hypothetical protein
MSTRVEIKHLWLMWSKDWILWLCPCHKSSWTRSSSSMIGTQEVSIYTVDYNLTTNCRPHSWDSSFWKSKAHISSLCTILTQQGSILNPIQKSTICRDLVLVQYYLQITLNLLYHSSELVWHQPKTWWGKNHEYQRKQGRDGAWKPNYCQRRSWKCSNLH